MCKENIKDINIKILIHFDVHNCLRILHTGKAGVFLNNLEVLEIVR